MTDGLNGGVYMLPDRWADGDAYERYVGRWSRLVAREFLVWLDVPAGQRWLDVGCGTGALVEAILASESPETVTGVDRSEGFIGHARARVRDRRATFQTGNATALPVEDAAFGAAVSALVLNFVPEPARMVAEMLRAVRAGGVVAAYVWDYAGEMQLMRRFWDAAVALDPAAVARDEANRFPMCRPDALAALFREAGADAVETRAIDVSTRFRDFDDYWSPFLSDVAPAPGYVMSLSAERRSALREELRGRLPVAADGSIGLLARAWAVRARH